MARVKVRTGMASFYVEVPEYVLRRHGYPYLNDAKKIVARKIAECVENSQAYMMYIYYGGTKEELRAIAKDCVDKLLARI